MALPLSWTAGFTRAIDNVLHDSDVVDDVLHSRARQCLEVLDTSSHHDVELFNGLEWAKRIHQAAPRRPVFTAKKLFNAMYRIADELSLVAGKRYVSAAICTCAGHVANAGGTSEEQAALLAEVLGQLSTIWAAFILWPFYARGHIRPTEPAYHSQSGDSTPTARHVEANRSTEQHRRWTQQIMARDNYWCPIWGSFDDDLYDLPAIPPNALSTILTTVPIIQPVVLTQDMHGDTVEHEIAAHALKHYFGVDDAIYEKLDSPQNGFAMSVASRTAFRRFMFSLRPTEKPNCYEFRDERPGLRFAGCQHVSDHITFVDHSATSPLVQQAAAMLGHSMPEGAVDLPSRDLLRLHATLAGVLRLSGAAGVFDGVRVPPSGSPPALPPPGGAAFWRSVVEYDGPAVCLEAELRDSLALARFRDSERVSVSGC
ncbi:hypothetical protein LXA43DRAFT_1125117 [Ganoderma leucocontextum]|nr:hypothetical protein LXA43DRAFT_1186993 [Ganoderma leucocontextum]KAI1784196.1 hypothetical protein LXA43DRAFT_1125117 [Ganoderma leucocontextum]